MKGSLEEMRSAGEDFGAVPAKNYVSCLLFVLLCLDNDLHDVYKTLSNDLKEIKWLTV